jgi:tRNA (guanine37-N1)-methyltransferase
LGDFQIREALFERVLARPRTLRDAVHATVPRNILSELPRSLDVVGDIAILELSPKLEPYSLAVANGILQINPHVRLVLRKASEITGVFRTRELQALGGFGGTETIHREFGCNYRLDASTVYFNPRLAHERQRVAKQVGEGDVVVDMFAGVGPYSILIAKLQPHSRVYALDINSSAINYLKENILTNGVADRVTPLLGDARQLSRGMIQAIADRVIMNLPSDAENYLDAASRILKGEGGYVHFYCFARRGVDLASVREHFKTALSAQRRRVQRFSCCNVVREISPSLVQVAIDVLVK